MPQACLCLTSSDPCAAFVRKTASYESITAPQPAQRRWWPEPTTAQRSWARGFGRDLGGNQRHRRDAVPEPRSTQVRRSVQTSTG
mmetsp:Transcript_22853/g.70433  ORF Transcript_22853/g.70433 Transcript_22853/m.70433 type:complete len:85 (+) Transcript_22853:531-785(+)